jgi:hypothetical protein
MIRVTKQQRANAIEARDVMWPSVPPENVMPDLGAWRAIKCGRGRPTCGAVACFGGWCAWWPGFRAQGVQADGKGMPTLPGMSWASNVSKELFGHSEMFMARGSATIDRHAPYELTDHELVTHRLNWLIANSKVIE